MSGSADLVSRILNATDPNKPRERPKSMSSVDLAARIYDATEPTAGDYLKAIPTSIAAGAVEGSGSLVSGLGAFTGSETLKRAGIDIAQAAPQVDPRLDESLISTVPRALGSSGPALVGGAVGGLVGGPVGAAAGAGLTSIGIEAGSGYQEALARGATPEDAVRAGLLTAPWGLLDVLPEASVAFRLARGVKVLQKASKPLGGIERLLTATERLGAPGALLTTAGGEFVQETAQGWGEELAQKLVGTIKDEDEARSLWEISQTDGVPASISGAIMEAVTRWVGHRRGGARRRAPLEGLPEAGLETAGVPGSNAPAEAAGVQGGASGGSTPAPSAAGVIEVPDEDLQGARDRLVRQAVGRGPIGAQIQPPTLREAPEWARASAARVGAKVALFDGADAMGVEGYYDPPSKTILISSAASEDEQARALLRHELGHFFADAHKDTYQAFISAIEAVRPGWLERQAQDREMRERALSRRTLSVEDEKGRRTEKPTQGPILTPEIAQEEAVAETLQSTPSFSALFRVDPELVREVATYDPGIVRRILNALHEFAKKLGLTKRRSIAEKIQELDAALQETGTRFEKEIGAQKAAQLALKLAELEDAITASEPRAQPRANERIGPQPIGREEALLGVQQLPDEAMTDRPVKGEPKRIAPKDVTPAETAARSESTQRRRTARAGRIFGPAVEAESYRRAVQASLEGITDESRRIRVEKAMRSMYERNKGSAAYVQTARTMREIARQPYPLKGSKPIQNVNTGDLVLLPDTSMGTVVRRKGEGDEGRVTVGFPGGRRETFWQRQIVDSETFDTDLPYGPHEIQGFLPPEPEPKIQNRGKKQTPNAPVPPVRARSAEEPRTAQAQEPVAEGAGEAARRSERDRGKPGSGDQVADAGGPSIPGSPAQEGEPRGDGRGDREGDRAEGDRGAPVRAEPEPAPASGSSDVDLKALVDAEIAAAFEPQPEPVRQKPRPPPSATDLFKPTKARIIPKRTEAGGVKFVAEPVAESASPEAHAASKEKSEVVSATPPVRRPGKEGEASTGVAAENSSAEARPETQGDGASPTNPPLPPKLSDFDQAIEDLRGMFSIPLDPKLDPDLYERARPRFETVAESIGKDASDPTSLVRAIVLYLRDVAKFTREKIEKIAPYIVQFAKERIQDPPDTTVGEHAAPLPATSNYRITASDKLGEGSWKTKARQNVRAMEIVKAAQREGRLATLEEQAELVKYVGWGASELANNVFGDAITGELKSEWKEIGERIRELATPKEYAEMKGSTLNAHYTSEEVVRAMWDTIQRLGFRGGNLIEPGMGIGHFLGMAPQSARDSFSYTGIEKDPITAQIAKLLYPKANVHNQDFNDFRAPHDFFDAAIGNPPFHRQPQLGDPEYAEQKLSLHDFFFVKTLDRVKPGGIVMFVTSRYSMDKMAERSRTLMSERADLLGAVRLPNTAFQKNAGTQVVTDIIVLQKRAPGTPAREGWLNTKDVEIEGQKVPINEYYAAHPEMVLGTPALVRGMHKENEYSVEPDTSRPIGEQIREALARIEARQAVAKSEPIQVPVAKTLRVTDKPIQEGSFHEHEGAIYLRENGQDVEIKSRTREVPSDYTSRDVEIIRSYVPLRDSVREVLRIQLQNAEGLEEAQRVLGERYDAFVARHGPINEMKVIETKGKNKRGENIVITRFPQFSAIQEDPEAYLVASIEDYDAEKREAKKGRFFTERTASGYRPPKIENAKDAMLVAMNERGKFDLERTIELSGMTRDGVLAELGDLVFEDPEGGYQTGDEYLSGNVRVKLARAQDAAERDARFQRNVEALQAVIPEDLTTDKIASSLGVPWVPQEDIEEFARTSLGIPVTVTRHAGTNIWSVAIPRWEERNNANIDTYGTDRRPAHEILAALLSGRPIEVKKTIVVDGKEKSVLDEEATYAAQDKATQIETMFQEWLWSDDKRRLRLTRYYNDNYNSTVERKYDGSFLSFAGMSEFFRDEHGLPMRKHQRDVVWRIISHGNTYMAHGVGAGKTLAMAAAAMEMRRLGLVRKPLFVVPNHMLQQFARETLLAYPGARILVADETQFESSRRRRFVAKAATGDWDAIFIKMSSFEDIAAPGDMLHDYISDQLEQLNQAKKDAGKGDRTTVKIIESRRKALQGKLDKLSKKKDVGITFDQLGVDFMFVDEAHYFRKLDIVTSRDRVKGVTPDGADKSIDFLLKSRWLDQQRPGRSVVLASGTPITNTMGELYTIQRYMDPRGLEAAGLDHFDAWASQFGRIVDGWETTASGKLARVSRFAKFVNIADLGKMVRKFMDVVPVKDLTYIRRPERVVETVIVTRSDDQVKAIKAMAERLETTHDRRAKNVLSLQVMTDAPLLATDPRFYMNSLGMTPHSGGEVSSKLTALVDNVHRIWEDTKSVELTDTLGGKKVKIRAPLTQMVFSDLGLPSVAATRGFSAYTFMREELIRRGVPAHEIALIEDFPTAEKKLRLFAAMNTGKVRVLIGSTAKMGTGVNAQRLMIALHNLDIPWLPADQEQREGRAVRQGNLNEKVYINRYATKGTYDESKLGTLARKLGFIESFLFGDPEMREMEDLEGEANAFAMARAMTSLNPLVIEQAETEAQVRKLSALAASHRGKIETRKQRLATYREQARRERLVAESGEALADRIPGSQEEVEALPFEIRSGAEWVPATGEEAVNKAIEEEKARIAAVVSPRGSVQTFQVARVLGATVAIEPASFQGETVSKFRGALSFQNYRDAVSTVSWKGILNRIQAVPTVSKQSRDLIAESEREIAAIEPTLGETFGQQDELQKARKRLYEIGQEIEKHAAADRKAGGDMLAGHEQEGESAEPEAEEEGRLAIPNEDINPKRKVPLRTVAQVAASFGRENADQTARTSKGEQVRMFQAAVRDVRLERQEIAGRDEAYTRAKRELRENSGLKEELLNKAARRGEFAPWETVALSLIADRSAQTMFGRGTVEAIQDATLLRWVYEDLRRRQARALGVIRDALREFTSGAEAFSSVLSIATEKNRQKLQDLFDELDKTQPEEGRLAIRRKIKEISEEEAKATKRVLEKLRKAGLDPQLVTLDYFANPYVFARAARIAATEKAGVWDYFKEYRIAAMLGGPMTQVANLTGNAASLGYTQVVERIAESVINTATTRDPNAASFGELKHYFKAWLPGLAQAGHNFLQAMVTELPVHDMELMRRGVKIPRLSSKIDEATIAGRPIGRQAIPGVFGRILRAPSLTLLQAVDEFFRTLASTTQATALAYRAARAEGLKGAAIERRMGEILADPTHPVHLAGWHTANEVTFQDADSPALKAILQFRRATDQTFRFPLGSVLFPFVTTPYRIFQRGLSIPFAPLLALHHWVTGKWKKTPGLWQHDMAESALGMGLTLALLWAFRGHDDDDDGLPLITGSRSPDYGEALLQERTAPSQSFRWGDGWVSYARLEPLSVALTTMVDLSDSIHAARGEGAGEAVANVVGRFGASLLAQAGDKTFLRTLGDTYRAITDPESGRTARTLRDTLVTPMIPNLFRTAARATDPYLRESAVRKTDDQGVWTAAVRSVGYEAIPVPGNAPPIRYDLWGRPMLRRGRSTLARLVDPLPENGQPDLSSLDVLIIRYNDRIQDGQFPGEDRLLPKPPERSYEGRDKLPHYWTAEEYARLQKESGELAARSLMRTRLHFDAPTPQDAQKIRDALSEARKKVKARILREKKQPTKETVP